MCSSGLPLADQALPRRRVLLAGSRSNGVRPRADHNLRRADHYIRLLSGFCYLAAILDAHSRKAVAWHLSRSIDAKLVLTCLEKALAKPKPPTGWIHHSDRGVLYACRG